MDYERIHDPPHRPSGGFSPAKLRAMLLGLEKHQQNSEDTSPDANDSGELDDRRSLECSTSTEMSSNSGHRSRNRAQDDDSFDSESSSSGPTTVKRSAPVSALLPPFSRPTPSKWDDAEKWISSPTANRTGRVASAAGIPPKKSAFAFPEHGTYPPAVAKVVAEVPRNTAALSDNSVGFTQPDSFKPAQAAPVVDEPEHVVRSVSMRDMGTEMTPIASQEPSRTGTPIIASSPTSSRTPTPQRSSEFGVGTVDSSNMGMSEEELQLNTRKEIMDLGERLGKTTIAAWASKEERATANFANVPVDEAVEIDRETRAADWQEAEKAKYLARFQREEVKIQAWENHQRAKIEAEMKRIEAKMERQRSREHDRLARKMSSASRRAEAKREAAEARRSQEAARAEEQAAQIRKTGHIPSSFSCWCWCL
uniref:Uncharacterized protein n=1 Tax=Avena sativa TaxID=4498 RepID=A0ACD5TT84_AVESA